MEQRLTKTDFEHWWLNHGPSLDDIRFRRGLGEADLEDAISAAFDVMYGYLSYFFWLDGGWVARRVVRGGSGNHFVDVTDTSVDTVIQLDRYVELLVDNACRKMRYLTQNHVSAEEFELSDVGTKPSVERAVHLRQMLSRLPKGERDVVEASLRGWSHRKIAHHLKIAKGSVSNRLKTAINKLRHSS